MKKYLDGYISYLRDEKSASQSTLQSYKRDVAQFFAYKEKLLGEKVTPNMISEKDLKDYMCALEEKGRSCATVSRFVASARGYFEYLHKQGILAENPAAFLHARKEHRGLPDILTSAEVDLLFTQPICQNFKGCRDKAMLELLYATGIRVSELIALNTTDVDLKSSVLYCQHDGKSRALPIYREAIQAVEQYLDRATGMVHTIKSEDALFVNVSGKRITRQGFWKIVKDYAEQAGIQKKITPHTLRHSFAAHLLENGADLKSIQQMLGHADISSTQIYERIVNNQFRSVYNRCHPKA